MITKLKNNEVFVFGANSKGFSGSGSAGYAQRGNIDIPWREDTKFLKSLVELNKKTRGLPYNASKLIGKWSILGSVGLMTGNQGKSYGIVTTEEPGFKGFVTDVFLKNEIVKLLNVVKNNSDLKFICVDFGLNRNHGGLSWWTPKEMDALWKLALSDFQDIVFSNLIMPSYVTKPKPIPCNSLLDLFSNEN